VANLDHISAFQDFRDRILEGIRTHFPDGKIEGRDKILKLEGLEVQDKDIDSDDIRSQHKAKVLGQTWAVPVAAQLRLVDKATGKTLDSKKVRIAEIPLITRRYSHIIDGQEYQIDNQWQLKPGVYTRRKQTGELEAHFNVPNQTTFKLNFDPTTKLFTMERGKSKMIPIYPLMKTLGVDDDTLEREWGKEILVANRNARGASTALDRFYRTDNRKPPASREEAERYFYETMQKSELRPESTALTLGKPLSNIDGEVFRRATTKILKVQAGDPEDDRDSLMFKDLRTAGDFAHDKLSAPLMMRSVRDKISRKINTASSVRDVIKFDMFNEPVRQTFYKNSAAQIPYQINPVEMLSTAQQTTIMGPGGIKSINTITDEQKFVNPSHLGFLDPVKTPENEKTGIVLRLPLGLKKFGREPKIPLYNIKTGKVEFVGPGTFMNSKVVLPDQVDWKDSKPVPVGQKVRMSLENNELGEGNFRDAQYVMRHPSQLFSVTSNLIPFLANTSGNRATYAASQIEQAISLKDREAPLVQVGTGSKIEGLGTFEEILGRQSGHVSPFNGRIVAVNKDAVIVQGDDGKKREVQLYNNFPLNDAKSFIDSNPTVKVGDRVKRGQSVADTNFTKGGRLALGVNLHTAYVPFKGYNFEDGVVISDSAAKKLASTHMHKPSMRLDEGMVTDTRRFVVQHPEAFKKDQYTKVGSDGVVKVGQKVLSGDPLIVAMKPYLLKDKMGYGAVRRSLSGVHTDASLRWDSDHPGEVVGVHKKGNEVTVHVRTLEPMQVGDKLAGRYGNKGICFDRETQVLTWSGWKYFYELSVLDEVCTLEHTTRRIMYQTPTCRTTYEYSGKMYRFRGRRLDLMTTPEHKLYVRAARDSEYRLEAAQECFGHQRIHLRTGVWIGSELTEVVIPGRPRRPGSKDHYEFCEAKAYDADDFLEFFGYWITEGCLSGTTHIRIAQRKSKNPETYEAIRQVLVRLGYEPSCAPDVLTISDPRLHSWLRQFGNSHTKFIHRPFLEATPRQLRVMADSLFAGDGGVYFREKDNHTRYELFTSSVKLADDYQELALKLGMSANVKVHHREDREATEYIVRWTMKDEVYTTKDGRYSSRSEEWIDYSGSVYCVEVPNHIIYVRRNGIPVWSGNCTMILPDDQMPKTKGGKTVEVVLNPSGVPGRMNVGQVFETAAAKIAEKTGKPYIVDNFSREDTLSRVKSDLKKHGISDTEELIDPEIGVSIGKALVGPQYILKLSHQVDKKISVRAGMGLPGSEAALEAYDLNLMPSGGAKTGGQSIGYLGMNALLAHGARANIREMQTWKSEGPDPQASEAKRWSSQHNDVWNAIQTGAPLPVPRHSFSFQKFTDMLRSAGINIEKKGHTFQLLPMTNRQILAMSKGELPNPTGLTYPKVDKDGDPKPIRGGLFDNDLTGGHGGKKWTHMSLAEPMPNPVFEGAIQKVLGLNSKEYTSIVEGHQAVDRAGKLVPLGTAGTATGGTAIQQMLKRIDVSSELKQSEKELRDITIPKTSAFGVATPKVDKLLKRVKYLRALDHAGMSADDAYVLKNLPIIPPVMRPASVLPDGNIRWADLNGLYSGFAQVNEQLKSPIISKQLTDDAKKSLRRDMYDGLKAIMGTTTMQDDGFKGVLHQIHGSQPKHGFFQKTLMNRRQDLTMRSVISPEPALGLDEVGLPEEKALSLYRPFVVKKMVDIGAANNPLEAQDMIRKKDPSSRRALEYVVQERPVLIKRDPALHKHSVQAFKPKLVRGRAIQIHPLVTSGFNADFDGDTMSAYVPVSREAVEEAHKMFPSNNLFNEATGKVAYQPTLESALGLYKLSLVKEGTAKTFQTYADALKAVQQKKIGVNDPVLVAGLKTTPGRIMLSDAVPPSMRKDLLSGKIPIDKKELDKLFHTLAKNHSGEFGTVSNRLKDIGNGASYGAVAIPHPDHQGPTAIFAKEKPKERIQYILTGTHSLSLDDFTPDKSTRDPILNRAQGKVDEIRTMKMPKAEIDRRSVDVWLNAAKEIEDTHKTKIMKRPNNLALMSFAGVKPDFNQYKQLVLAPVLVQDASGKLVPTPIKQSYSEGLDVAGYWTQMSGARRGSVMKVQEVRDPGYLSKQLIASSMNLVVVDHDCGTSRGVAMNVGDSDVHDRELVRDFSAKNVAFKAGTLLSPDIVAKIRTADKSAQIVVRSPLKCEHGKGLCQKCAGLSPSGRSYPVGTNLGILSAQSLGERSMQLTLKAFHTGGVQSVGGSKLINQFGRIEQLTRLPKDIPDSATLAMKSGTVEKVESDPTGLKIWISGQAHHVGKDRSGMPLYEALPHQTKSPTYVPWMPPKVGTRVEAGQSLSDPNRTVINPHHLYRATGNMEKVQNFLVNELHDIYGKEGVRKTHVETVVKAMSNLTKVIDPGDAPGILRGEFQPHSQMRSLNTTLMQKGRKPVQHTPVLQGVDMLPLSVQEDWLAKLMHSRLRQTLQEAAATGAISNIHGLHPIPGAAYGAEFGLTARHAPQLGLKHLKDVPVYSY
jgi:DNA-directed RNA polymerase subunit beta'